jgi:hypothetical protein
MSQTGQIISASPLPYGNDWIVQYSYQLDAGGTGQSEVVVGNTSPPPAFPSYPPTVGFWASATSTVQITAPGSSNPVLLPCPPLIQFAAFGIAAKGFPTS